MVVWKGFRGRHVWFDLDVVIEKLSPWVRTVSERNPSAIILTVNSLVGSGGEQSELTEASTMLTLKSNVVK